MQKKSRKLIGSLMIILLVTLLGGCEAYNKEAEKRTSVSLTIVSESSKEGDASEGTVIASTGNTTSTPSSNASVTVTGTMEDLESAINNYVITPVTEGLCEQIPVSERGGLAVYNAFNRLERNNSIELMLEHKVCIDDATGVVYYVNVGRDYFIYRIKDGKSELAVELPANYLYTHEGVLYFLLDAQNIVEGVWKDSYKGRYMYDKFTFKGMSEGDIYSYTPATGKVELVYSAQALRLKVTDKGIYYLKGELDKTDRYNATGFEWYYLSFGGSEPKKIDNGGMYDIWNGYQYDWSEDTLRIKSEVTGDSIEVVQNNNYIRSCVFGDKIFVLNVKPVAIPKCFDLLTKDEIFSCNLEESIAASDWAPQGDESLDLSLRMWQSNSLQNIIDKKMIQSTRFALTDDSMLWFVIQQYIYRINLDTGETQLFYYNAGNFSEPSQLYTDGENLYAIYYSGGIVGEEPVFMRLIFGYEEKTDVWYWDVTDKIGVND